MYKFLFVIAGNRAVSFYFFPPVFAVIVLTKPIDALCSGSTFPSYGSAKSTDSMKSLGYYCFYSIFISFMDTWTPFKDQYSFFGELDIDQPDTKRIKEHSKVWRFIEQTVQFLLPNMSVFFLSQSQP